MYKKEFGGRTKAFKERVTRLLKRQGWAIEKQPKDSIVDLLATRAGGARRAFLVKPHGHITRTEIAAIHKYEAAKGIGIVYIHEGSGAEILFSRMYKLLVAGSPKW